MLWPFAQKYGLSIRPVIGPGEGDSPAWVDQPEQMKEASSLYGVLLPACGDYAGMTSEVAQQKLVEYANADALDAHAALVPPGSERELKKYSRGAALSLRARLDARRGDAVELSMCPRRASRKRRQVHRRRLQETDVGRVRRYTGA